MTIRTYGRTAHTQVTDAKIAETQRLITGVRANRGQQPCTWAEATEIATTVAGAMTIDRINAKALRLRDRIGRRTA